MATLPMAVHPPLLSFTYGTTGRYGPYPLGDNTRGGNPQTPYTLRLVDVGRHFTLQAPGGSNTVYGPFPATNGAPVLLGGALMTVVRSPPPLDVSISHPGRIAQLPLIGIAPDTPAVRRELYLLRAKYQALADRVAIDTSDVALEGVPRIRTRRTGNTTVSPVVSVSRRDKQNVIKGAELTAIRFLETLFQQQFRIRSQSASGPTAYRFGMPPGDYIFCALQKVKDPEAQGAAASLTAVWWTPFTFDGDHPLSLSLTAENAITWREIFVFEE
jgi:hypothetical protein